MRDALLEISVAVPAEFEDAVGKLLETFFSLPATIYFDARTQKTFARIYLARKSDWTPPTRSRLRQALQSIFQPVKISARKIRRENWAESWKRHFQPLEFGDVLLVRPGWSRRRPRRGQAVVVLDPGLSFGTGQHPTTSFCLEEIVAGAKKIAPGTFLDVGTGSGILAIAAARLDYSPVEAIDFDPVAVRISRENMRRNRVNRRIQVRRGDILRLSPRPRRRFDLVCANLIADVLLQAAETLAVRVKPRGALVLAGILKTQFAEVRERYESLGWRMKRSQTEAEWCSARFERRS
jgi:ribosomal protein L11 methyltransferase